MSSSDSKVRLRTDNSNEIFIFRMDLTFDHRTYEWQCVGFTLPARMQTQLNAPKNESDSDAPYKHKIRRIIISAAVGPQVVNLSFQVDGEKTRFLRPHRVCSLTCIVWVLSDDIRCSNIYFTFNYNQNSKINCISLRESESVSDACAYFPIRVRLMLKIPYLFRDIINYQIIFDAFTMV